MSKWRKQGLSPDGFVEPAITIAGVCLDNEQAKVVREAVERYYADDPISTPPGTLSVRDLVRGLTGGRFDRAPAHAANVISLPSATPLR
jgi:hypothetical protein